MSELYLCLGKKSSIPYFLSGLGLNIYSMDELLYYLVRDAYILDNDLFDDKLCDYISHEMALPELGEMLKKMVHLRRPIGEIVTTLLTTTGYLDEEEIRRVRQILVDNASLSFASKRKVRGDHLLEAGKFSRAIEEYRYILANLSKEEEPDIYSAILHNIGCSYARLFLFEKACLYFKDAYDIDNNRDSLIMYLATKRLLMGAEEFDRMALRYGYDELDVAQAKQRLAMAQNNTKDSKLSARVQTLRSLREEGKVSEYYHLADTTLFEWKQDYRCSTSGGV